MGRATEVGFWVHFAKSANFFTFPVKVHNFFGISELNGVVFNSKSRKIDRIEIWGRKGRTTLFFIQVI